MFLDLLWSFYNLVRPNYRNKKYHLYRITVKEVKKFIFFLNAPEQKNVYYTFLFWIRTN